MKSESIPASPTRKTTSTKSWSSASPEAKSVCSACRSGAAVRPGGAPRIGLRLAATLSVAALLASVIGCRSAVDAPEVEASPIVVITMGALPVSLVGSLGGEEGWTPSLDELAREAWSVRAVSPSSSPIPALASLLTGVDAWSHQLVSHRAEGLRADIETVPGTLGANWSRRAYVPLRQRFQEYGLLEDFDSVEELPPIESLAGMLREVQGRTLLWIHLPDPAFPWLDRSSAVPGLGTRTGSFDRLERRWLMPFADPSLDIPEPLRSEAEELLRHQVAWADHRVGQLIAALRENPGWRDLWLFVTALHGVELGEHGQVLFAQNLQRASLEVPLFAKLDEREPRRPAQGHFVSSSRLAATVLEAAGQRPAPALEPSIFAAPGVAFSSLYDHGGANRLSLVRSNDGESAIQVTWSRRYADEEPEWWAAQAIESGLGSQPIDESPRLIIDRLRKAFQVVPPLEGRPGTQPEVHLVRWTAAGDVEPWSGVFADPSADQLLRRWRLFDGEPRAPREARSYWSAARR